GVENADSGTVSRKQGLTVGYLPQDFQLDEEDSVEANIRAGSAALIEAIARYETDPDLSPAESARLLALIEHGDGWNLETRVELLRRELSAPPGNRIVGHLSGG